TSTDSHHNKLPGLYRFVRKLTRKGNLPNILSNLIVLLNFQQHNKTPSTHTALYFSSPLTSVSTGQPRSSWPIKGEFVPLLKNWSALTVRIWFKSSATKSAASPTARSQL